MISSFVRALVSAFKARRELALDNVALRQQLAVLRRSVKRPRLSDVDHEFWVLLRVLPRRVQKYKRTKDPRAGTFRIRRVYALVRHWKLESSVACPSSSSIKPAPWASAGEPVRSKYSCASCPKMRTEPKFRILEAFSRFAETSRRGTGSAIGEPEQTSPPDHPFRPAGCLRCLLLVMCTYPFAKTVLTLYLARGEGLERDFGCNLLQRKVLASSHQHLMAEAPRRASCPKIRTEPKARILEVFSKLAETSRRGTDPAIGAAEQSSPPDHPFRPA